MAKPASRTNPDAAGGSSVFTGVLIGLTVGAVLAVGVALFVTGNNPFKSGSSHAGDGKNAAAGCRSRADRHARHRAAAG